MMVSLPPESLELEAHHYDVNINVGHQAAPFKQLNVNLFSFS